MSAPELTDRLVEAILSEKYDAIITNYANCDMVGHTGNFKAAVKADALVLPFKFSISRELINQWLNKNS